MVWEASGAAYFRCPSCHSADLHFNMLHVVNEPHTFKDKTLTFDIDIRHTLDKKYKSFEIEINTTHNIPREAWLEELSLFLVTSEISSELFSCAIELRF